MAISSRRLITESIPLTSDNMSIPLGRRPLGGSGAVECDRRFEGPGAGEADLEPAVGVPGIEVGEAEKGVRDRDLLVEDVDFRSTSPSTSAKRVTPQYALGCQSCTGILSGIYSENENLNISFV